MNAALPIGTGFDPALLGILPAAPQTLPSGMGAAADEFIEVLLDLLPPADLAPVEPAEAGNIEAAPRSKKEPVTEPGASTLAALFFTQAAPLPQPARPLRAAELNIPVEAEQGDRPAEAADTESGEESDTGFGTNKQSVPEPVQFALPVSEPSPVPAGTATPSRAQNVDEPSVTAPDIVLTERTAPQPRPAPDADEAPAPVERRKTEVAFHARLFSPEDVAAVSASPEAAVRIEAAPPGPGFRPEPRNRTEAAPAQHAQPAAPAHTDFPRSEPETAERVSVPEAAAAPEQAPPEAKPEGKPAPNRGEARATSGERQDPVQHDAVQEEQPTPPAPRRVARTEVPERETPRSAQEWTVEAKHRSETPAPVRADFPTIRSWTVETPGSAVPTGRDVRPAPIAETAPPAPAELPDLPPKPPSSPVTNLRLKLGDDSAASVELHVAQRAGEVQVSVRTSDPGLNTSLREELPSLVQNVQKAGYAMETSTPASGSGTQNSDAWQEGRRQQPEHRDGEPRRRRNKAREGETFRFPSIQEITL